MVGRELALKPEPSHRPIAEQQQVQRQITTTRPLRTASTLDGDNLLVGTSGQPTVTRKYVSRAQRPLGYNPAKTLQSERNLASGQ